MTVDIGTICAVLGVLGASLTVMASMLINSGKLMNRFEEAMTKMAKWDDSIKHLSAIPDIKQAIEGLAEGQKRHTSDISQLRERSARIEGKLNIGSHPSLHEIQT